MRANILICDEMYILKRATADTVLSKKRNPENMTSEALNKVLVLLRRHKDKSIPKISNDILIRYCQWVHVEKRERRVNDVENTI